MERASKLRRTVRACVTGLLVLFFLPIAVLPQSEKQTAVQNTQVVLLGTGTPSPDPERSGPATAVVVNGTPYLIDFGPGVVRRIAAASQQGVKGLTVVNVRVAFLTHLHSDHTIGYADLILTPWSVGRSQPLEVYGPKGLKHMTSHILEAYREDIAIRRRDKQVLGVPEQEDGYKVRQIRHGYIISHVQEGWSYAASCSCGEHVVGADPVGTRRRSNHSEPSPRPRASRV